MFKSIKKIPLWLVLLIAGFAVFYSYDIDISQDMGEYMVYARSILSGKGYSYIDGSPVLFRGPLFSLMIAIAFKLFGATPWSAFWIVRIFCILNPIMLYLLGKRLFNKWVGFGAALMILTSYTLNFWSYRHLDAVWPFFIYLAIYLFYGALEKENKERKKKKILFIAAGVSIALGFLVKEVVVLFFPLPLFIVLSIPRYLKKSHLKLLLILYAALFICIVPWLAHQLIQGGPAGLFGNAGRHVVKSMVSGEQSPVSGPFQLAENSFWGFFKFYQDQQNSLTRNFWLAPLFLLSWLSSMALAIRKDLSLRILLCAAFCFLPIIVYIGLSGYRQGQVIFIYHLCYLVLAVSAWKAVRYIRKLAISHRLKVSPHGHKRIFALLIVMAMFLQLSLGALEDLEESPGRDFFENTFISRIFQEEIISRRIIGGFDDIDRLAAQWLDPQTLAGDAVIFSSPEKRRAFFIYSKKSHPLYLIPLKRSDFKSHLKPMDSDDSIILLSSWSRRLDPRNRIEFLTEKALLQSIENHRIRYIITGKRRNYLSFYFDANPSFEKIKEFDEGQLKIYRVLEEVSRNPYPVLVNTYIKQYLGDLKSSQSWKYDRYLNEVFKGTLSQDETLIDDILKGLDNDRIKIVRDGFIYKPDGQ